MSQEQLRQQSPVSDQVFRVGPDECDTRLSACAGESRIFRQKAVAWMNGFGATLPGDGDELFYIQVGLFSGLATPARHQKLSRVNRPAVNKGILRMD